MHDQVLDLADKGVEAMLACGDTTDAEYNEVGHHAHRARRLLKSLMPRAETMQIRKQFNMGHPRKRIMYITPESLTGTNSKWMPIIRVAYRNGQLRRLVIDEAHCITVSFLVGTLRIVHTRAVMTS
jgi:bloom syndrome protein